MTINLYTELMRAADSRGGEYTRRLIGYALRLCEFYTGADIDAVFAAAALRIKDDDYITEALSRAEWTEDRITLTLDCVRLLERFSTGNSIPSSGVTEGKKRGGAETVEKPEKNPHAEVNIPGGLEKGGKNSKLTSGLSTVSTEFSTGREDASRAADTLGIGTSVSGEERVVK